MGTGNGKLMLLRDATADDMANDLARQDISFVLLADEDEDAVGVYYNAPVFTTPYELIGAMEEAKQKLLTK